MATITETVRTECENLGERATEVWRRASKVTEDVGALKTAAQDVLEEGKEVAARSVESMRRTARDLRHMPNDVAYRVRQEPLRAVGLAIGFGLIVGGGFAWLMTRSARTPAADGASSPRNRQAS